MAQDNTWTGAGNLTRDPSLEYVGTKGTALAKFGIAWNPPRRLVNDKWVDQDAHFFDVTCWGDVAEHVAESLSKGDRAHITGSLDYQTWEKDGERKSKVEIRADEVSPSMRWATAQVTRVKKGEGGGTAPKPAPSNYEDEPF